MNLIDKKLTYLFGEGEFEDIGFPSVFRDNWPNVRDHFFYFFLHDGYRRIKPRKK